MPPAYLATALLAAQLAMDAPAPAPPAPSLSARVSDPAVIRAAVREALAARSQPPAPRGATALSGDAHASFTRAVDEARVPGCLNTDAMKHQPPHIGAIDFTGLMAVPFWVSAMVRGKCH
jgi:hypothetical protein